MSAAELCFMGIGEPETFRCRVYGCDETDERIEFLQRLAGPGVLDAPGYDARMAALDGRGWVAATFEPADGGGQWKRWRLTDAGRTEVARLGVRL